MCRNSNSRLKIIYDDLLREVGNRSNGHLLIDSWRSLELFKGVMERLVNRIYHIFVDNYVDDIEK